MGAIDNINSGEMRKFISRVERLERAAPTGFSSITRGQFRVGGSAQILVDSSGGMSINGSFVGAGTFVWTGPMSLVGTQTVTGVLNVNGPWNLAGTGGITGAVSCTGNWTWSGNLTLTGSGAIQAGSTKLDSTGLSNPSILFLNTPQVAVQHDLVVGGSTQLSGPTLTLPNIPTTTAASNLNIDPTTKTVRWISSAARYKIDAQPMALPAALLDVPVKDWIDKGQHERGEVTGRIPGVIAEEVEAAGGEAFVTYDGDGLIQGVAYDRLALARTQILADRLDRATKTIADQGKTIAELTAALGRIVGLLEGNTTEGDS
jgi:hypothetical protein